MKLTDNLNGQSAELNVQVVTDYANDYCARIEVRRDDLVVGLVTRLSAASSKWTARYVDEETCEQIEVCTAANTSDEALQELFDCLHSSSKTQPVPLIS